LDSIIKEILCNSFIPNIIEKIVYTDIENRLRGFHESLSRISQIIDGNLIKIKKESELEGKIDDILAPLRVFNDISPINKNTEFNGFEATNATPLSDLQKSTCTIIFITF